MTSYGRNKYLDEIKKIAGQVLTYKSKSFLRLNRKPRPGTDYEWIGKTILRKISSKKWNIAGRLPKNSRNSFVDLQSQKNSKKDRPKKFVFSLKADML